jgi:hypothetical protein
MRKTIVLILAVASFGGFVSGPGQHDQHADDIARALAERLNDFHDHIVLLDHEPLYVNLEIKQKRGQVLFNGNKVFLLRVKSIDLETETLSIGDYAIQMQGNGPEAFYLDRFKKQLYALTRDGQRDLLATVDLEARGPVLRVTLSQHERIWIDVSHRYRKAVLYIKNHPLFRLNMKYFPIKGERRENVMRLKGDGPRALYCNYSRKILYFREGEERQRGRFADLRYESGFEDGALQLKK